jgi:hypothetical protein
MHKTCVGRVWTDSKLLIAVLTMHHFVAHICTLYPCEIKSTFASTHICVQIPDFFGGENNHFPSDPSFETNPIKMGMVRRLQFAKITYHLACPQHQHGPQILK